MRMRPLLHAALLFLVPALALAPASVIAVEAIAPHEGHLHFAFAATRGAKVQSRDLESFATSAHEPGFLSLPSGASDDPLAPCALLAAAATSQAFNMLFYAIINPGKLNIFPPPGTNIMGAYDAAIARSKGAIPRDKPGATADILARLLVYHSWGVTSMLNTLVSPLSQGECLRILSAPPELEKRLSGLRAEVQVQTHGPAVDAYIGSAKREEGDRFLAQLREADFLERSSASMSNPLAPCSLVAVFRLAARLNESWAGKMAQGTFEPGDRPELAAYADRIKGGEYLKAPSAESAELVAAMFAAEIGRARELSGLLLEKATQRQCLEEILKPGTLRRQLLEQGITLPMR